MNVVLYIGVRTEIDSLYGGCLGAQSAHVGGVLEEAAFDQDKIGLWKMWGEEHLFGKTILLAASWGVEDFLKVADKTTDVVGTLHDPSYRVTDGKLVTYVPTDTLGYILTSNPSTIHKTKTSFSLYKEDNHVHRRSSS